MRCISKRLIGKRLIGKRLAGACILAALLTPLCGCGNVSYAFPYDSSYQVTSFQIINTVNASVAESFAEDLCVINDDFLTDADTSQAVAALLCDVNNQEVLYAKNVHERLHPASLTKIMTALVAIKYGSLDQIITATDAVTITEKGAQLCGIKPGDSMTLDQALHVLLINSANDAGMLIAEGIGGDVETFVNMMNEEAQSLGATNTHFVNPHGLTAEEHYTTAYDLYLIFNEAIKYETFREIIHMDSYSTVYHDKNGREKELSVSSTNWYFVDKASAPDSITVVGGKTGSTTAARNCLILLARDTSGNPYISVILSAESRDILYKEMTELLSEIGK